MKVIKITLQSVPVNQVRLNQSTVICCGLTRKVNKSCLFCGKGPAINRPTRIIVEGNSVKLVHKAARSVPERYTLVPSEEISSVPRGDHYMER